MTETDPECGDCPTREVKPGMYAVEYTEEERRELYSVTDEELEEFFADHPEARVHYEELQRLKRLSIRYWVRRGMRWVAGILPR